MFLSALDFELTKSEIQYVGSYLTMNQLSQQYKYEAIWGLNEMAGHYLCPELFKIFISPWDF